MACKSDELYHHGILGMKWGVRRYQNKDGSLTPAGMKRYSQNKELARVYGAVAEDSKARAEHFKGEATSFKALIDKKGANLTDEDIYKVHYYLQKYGKNDKLDPKKTLKKIEKAERQSVENSEAYYKAAQKLLNVDNISKKTPKEIIESREKGAKFVAGFGGAMFGTSYAVAAINPIGPAVAAAMKASTIAALPVSVLLQTRAHEESAVKTFANRK